MLPEEDINRLKGEAKRLFIELRVIEALAKIPLDLKFEKMPKKWNEQFYIHKIENEAD